MSLPVLAAGVAVVNLSSRANAAAEAAQRGPGAREPYFWTGLAAALCAACFSGYASVYVERVLKTERLSWRAWPLPSTSSSSDSPSKLAVASAPGGKEGGGEPGMTEPLSPASRMRLGGSLTDVFAFSSDKEERERHAAGLHTRMEEGSVSEPALPALVLVSPSSSKPTLQPPSLDAAASALPVQPLPDGSLCEFGRPLLTLNIQLAAWGAALSAAQLLLLSSPSPSPADAATALRAHAAHSARLPADRGWLTGFNAYTWAVIWLQALGGLVVGIVLKYSDNLVKGFATAVSILLSCVLERTFERQLPSPTFVLGLLLVLSSFLLFSGPEDLLARGLLLCGGGTAAAELWAGCGVACGSLGREASVVLRGMGGTPLRVAALGGLAVATVLMFAAYLTMEKEFESHTVNTGKVVRPAGLPAQKAALPAVVAAGGAGGVSVAASTEHWGDRQPPPPPPLPQLPAEVHEGAVSEAAEEVNSFRLPGWEPSVRFERERATAVAAASGAAATPLTSTVASASVTPAATAAEASVLAQWSAGDDFDEDLSVRFGGSSERERLPTPLPLLVPPPPLPSFSNSSRLRGGSGPVRRGRPSAEVGEELARELEAAQRGSALPLNPEDGFGGGVLGAAPPLGSAAIGPAGLRTARLVGDMS